MWLEPDEWHGNAEAGQLQLLSAHPAHRLHSQLNHTALRERYAVAGREPVTIHPQDAQARGIVDGDLVRVWNARGQVLAGAVVTEGIRPGVICLHEGAWPDTGSAGRHLQKRGGERLNQRYSDIPAGQRLCREHRSGVAGEIYRPGAAAYGI